MYEIVERNIEVTEANAVESRQARQQYTNYDVHSPTIPYKSL